MNLFGEVFLFMAQVGFFLLAVVVILRWVAVPYLWFRYDRPIQAIKDGLVKFKKDAIENARGRGITTAVFDQKINAEQKKVTEKLDILELKRRQFLDRISLLLTLTSLGK